MDKKVASTRPKPDPTRPPVDETSKVWVFSGLIRKLEFFERAVGLIKEEHFGEHERWLSLVWSIVAAYHREFQELPTKNIICTKCGSVIERDPKALTDTDIGKLNEFIGLAFDLGDEDWPERSVMAVLQQFLEDRLLSGALSSLMKPATPLALSQVFSDLSETAASLSTLSSTAMAEPFAEGWHEGARTGERIPTNVKFVDDLMDGGQVRGESYGLLGPTGGGKTTLAVQLGGEAAKRVYYDWERSGYAGKAARVYHVTYEDPTEVLRLRALSYVAGIPRKRLEDMIHAHDFSTLSTPGNLQEYEQKRFKRLIQSGGRPACEKTRFERAICVLNESWRIIDFTGLSDSDSQAKGQGMVDEIAAYIRQDLSKSPGVSCANVYVDYALAAVEAHIEWNKKDHSEMRHLINRFPWFMRRKIAIPFNCPTWVTQQLNTDANAARRGSLPGASESSEGRAFAFACDFAFVLGIAMQDGRVPFAGKKHRRTAELQPKILKICGADSKLVDVSHKWSLNDRTKSIDPKREVDHFKEVTSDQPEIQTQGTLSPAHRRLLKQQGAIRSSDIESLT